MDEYRDETAFTKNLHSVDEIIDALRHKKYGRDVREALAQAVAKLYGVKETIGSSTPTGAFMTLQDLQLAYPNGMHGIFVVAETGSWYVWDVVSTRWVKGGLYQVPISFSELENEKIVREKNDKNILDKLNSNKTAVELKKARIVDNYGNLLVDNDKYMVGNVVLPKTDSTGLEVGVPADSGSVGYTFLGHLEEYGLPILKLESPNLLSLQTKADGKLSGVKFDYNPNGNEGVRLSGTLKSIKVQGSSSQAYSKKNYTLNFEDDVQLKSTWGSQDKYVIKADWVDFSHMRNEFGAYLWGLMRKTRIDIKRDSLVDGSENFLIDNEEKSLVGETTKQFATPNFGAIDSFPILVVINGIYWGLYSLTIPKDDWMANMDNGEKEAIVSAENHGFTTRFLKHVKADSQGNLAGSDFSVEYVSDESEQQWVVESLNKTIDSVVNTTGTVEGIRDYIDVDSATDYFILNALILNSDAYDKNFLLQTWDGKKWYFSAYDMDATFGNRWDGKAYYKADWLGFKEQESLNRVFHLIYAYDKDNFINRWETLRNGLLSNENLSNLIYNYTITIPKAAFDYEAKRWPRRPGTITNNIGQIQSWIMLRLSFLDKEINNLKL